MTTPHRGHTHRQLRRQWADTIALNGGFTCWRCGEWFTTPAPHEWDLGHVDNNPDAYQGPECLPCNRGAGARRGNRMRRHRSSQDW